MTKVCKRHADNPVMIYHQCVGCELEWFREELEQKQQEIERLRAELEDERRLHDFEKRQHDELRETVQKMIDGLRWYADSETYEGNVEWDDDGNIIRAEWPPINVDNGQRAREILKEIGVTDV